MPREHSRREEIHRGPALGTIGLPDPEEVQHVPHRAVVQIGLVERPNLVRHVALDRAEGLADGLGLVSGKPVSHEEVGHPD